MLDAVGEKLAAPLVRVLVMALKSPQSYPGLRPVTTEALRPYKMCLEKMASEIEDAKTRSVLAEASSGASSGGSRKRYIFFFPVYLCRCRLSRFRSR